MIECTDLTKVFRGSVRALDGLSLKAERGEVVGIAGPNGAGKSSTIEILEGMRTPDRGTARVCGLDPEKAGDDFKQQISALIDRIKATPRQAESSASGIQVAAARMSANRAHPRLSIR